MKRVKTTAIASVVIIFLVGYFALHYYYFTDFYRDCRKIGDGGSRDEVQKTMAQYSSINRIWESEVVRDESISYTVADETMYCEIDLLEGRVVDVTFVPLSP